MSQRDGLGRVHQASDAREFQEFAQQPTHFVGSIANVCNVRFEPLGVALGGVLLKQAEEAFDRDERAFEVVRNGVGKALQLGILDFQIFYYLFSLLLSLLAFYSF